MASRAQNPALPARDLVLPMTDERKGGHMHIDRRAFLGLGVGALAWVACGRSEKDSAPSATQVPLSLAVASVEHAIGDRRVAIAYMENGVPTAPRNPRMSLISPDGKPVKAEGQIVTIGFRGGSAPAEQTDARKLVIVDHLFEDAGTWRVRLSTGDRELETPFTVLEKSASPMVGDASLMSESATKDDPKGVDPLCTLNPVCKQHDLTVAEAVSSGKPSVISFVTPALCESRTCGPTLDIVENTRKKVGDEVNFVHIEMYKDLQAKQQAETVAEWKLPGEPWVVFVGGDGKVKARWSGAVGVEEFPGAVAALAANKL